MYQDKKKAPKWGLFAGLSAPFPELKFDTIIP